MSADELERMARIVEAMLIDQNNKRKDCTICSVDEMAELIHCNAEMMSLYAHHTLPVGSLTHQIISNCSMLTVVVCEIVNALSEMAQHDDER